MIDKLPPQFPVETTDVMQTLEVLFELADHKPEHLEYWYGHMDSLCVILGKMTNLPPHLRHPDLVALLDEWRGLAAVDRLERELIDGQGFSDE